MPDSLDGYAVHVLLSVGQGRTDEASIQCASLYEVTERVREVMLAHQQFRAITIVHAEDLPALLEGAVPTSRGLADPSV